MAQTGFTPIQLYSTSTAAVAPSASNLTNSTLGSELAINITDGKLFYKDNANAIQVIGWKTVPTTAGGTGLTSYTAGDTLFYASGTVLSKLGIGAANTVLTSSGTAPQWSTDLNIGSLTATSISDSGNLTFTGTGNRIAGDFSNATLTNRVAFQTSTTNGNTSVAVLPNGTGTTALFNAYGSENPTNASRLLIGIVTNATADIRSDVTGTGTALPLVFHTGGSEKVRLDTSGNFGIGVTPTQKLQVSGNALVSVGNFMTNRASGGANTSGSGLELMLDGVISAAIRQPASEVTAFYRGTGGTVETMRINATSDVLIGRTTTGFNKTTYGWQFSKDAESFGTINTAGSILTLNRNNDGDIFRFYRDGTQQGWIGVATTGTTYGNLSDRRKKQNFVASPQALEKLMNVNVQSFDWKDGGHTEFGLVAQELNEVLPFAVTAGDDGDIIEKPWGIDNTKIVPVLIKAIQEQQSLIAQLQLDVLELKEVK
jgi:hypothetical protein